MTPIAPNIPWLICNIRKVHQGAAILIAADHGGGRMAEKCPSTMSLLPFLLKRKPQRISPVGVLNAMHRILVLHSCWSLTVQKNSTGSRTTLLSWPVPIWKKAPPISTAITMLCTTIVASVFHLRCCSFRHRLNRATTMNILIHALWLLMNNVAACSHEKLYSWQALLGPCLCCFSQWVMNASDLQHLKKSKPLSNIRISGSGPWAP